jgi:hypothetical protein
MSVSRKGLLWACLGLAAGAGGLDAYWIWTRPAPRVAPVPQLPTVADALARYQASFELTPDRRFLDALGAVRRITTGHPPVQVSATASDKGWDITVDGQPAGQVSALPGFDELLGVLVADATRNLTAKGRIERPAGQRPRWPADEFFPRTALPALARLGSAWDSATSRAETAARAAQLLTGLLLQVHGPLETDGPLAARALAAVAIARALDPDAVKSEECLVAYLLGYSSRAEKLVTTAVIDPAVAAYVAGRDVDLDAAVARSSADPRARYLQLLRLAD